MSTTDPIQRNIQYTLTVRNEPRSKRGCCSALHTNGIHHTPTRILNTGAALLELPGSRSLHTTHGKDTRKLGEDVRAALRLLTHPVVVVTAFDSAEGSQTQADRLSSCRGVTVSSFNTVTLQPAAYVTFNLKVPSRSWDAILKSRHFRVHLLTADSHGASIAHAFTQPYERAHEPFHQLSQLGVKVHAHEPLLSPLIAASKGVLAHISAVFLPEKSVTVGDHILIVAEVLDCEHVDVQIQDNAAELGSTIQSSAGLAYAAKGYRAQGQLIEVPEPEASLSTSDSRVVRNALQEAEEDDRNRSSALPHADSGATGSTAFTPVMDSRSTRSSSQVAFRPSPRHMSQRSLHPLDSHSPTHDSTSNPRTYATTGVPGADAEGDTVREIDDIVEPTERQTTVADFFNLPDDDRDAWRFPHINKLLEADKSAKWAADRLKNGFIKPDVPLSESDVQRLEKQVAVNERRVAKKLSKTAARSLRVMLDKGRVNFVRAQWLESSIERGQVALLDELAQVREMYEQDKIDQETFRMATEQLQHDLDVLVTETMRLRQLVDEES